MYNWIASCLAMTQFGKTVLWLDDASGCCCRCGIEIDLGSEVKLVVIADFGISFDSDIGYEGECSETIDDARIVFLLGWIIEEDEITDFPFQWDTIGSERKIREADRIRSDIVVSLNLLEDFDESTDMGRSFDTILLIHLLCEVIFEEAFFWPELFDLLLYLVQISLFGTTLDGDIIINSETETVCEPCEDEDDETDPVDISPCAMEVAWDDAIGHELVYKVVKSIRLKVV